MASNNPLWAGFAVGAVVTPMSVAEFKAFVNGESAKCLNVIKETGVTLQ